MSPKNTFAILVSVLLLLIVSPLNGCFILILTDGSRVIVGNHEDWFEQDAAIRIIPATDGKYGSVIFTFESEGWAQGGMNSEGLFFDGALTPMDILVEEELKPEYKGYLWQKILDECTTVKQAIDTAMQYRKMELQEAHIVLADATGDAALIGIKDGEIIVTYKKPEDPYLLQTNFNPLMPDLSDEPFCWRFESAEEHLINNSEATTENMLSILKDTHQDEMTVYTNIYDLSSRNIIVFSQRKFDKPININVDKALAGGPQMISLEKLLLSPKIFE